MQPFTLSKQAQDLKADFLPPSEFAGAARRVDQSEVGGFLRHWLMDGTPYVFFEMPMLYESIRTWLSSRLQINPLEIKLIGSARTGFSLAPPPDFGKPFGPASDLDIAVVSADLFWKCKLAFEQWKADYKSGTVSPRHAKEKFYWGENATVVPSSLGRGFIDPNKIPTFNRYPISQTIAETMRLLKTKLDISVSAPNVRKATIRVYNTWQSFHKQVKINFSRTNIIAANSA